MATKEQSQTEKPTSAYRPPRLMLVWTVLVFAALAFMNLGVNWINEQFSIQPGVINLLKILLVFVTVLAWFCWLLFFSKHRFRYLIAPIVASLLVLFFYLFRIVFDGDMDFVRIEPRFQQRQFTTVSSAAPAAETTNTNLLSIAGPDDFNQFLGNDRRDSKITNRNLDPDWKLHPPKIVWRQEVGEGWSGFVAVNGLAITQEQRAAEECVTCYDIATGELRWIHSALRRHEDQMAMGKVGPRATPSIHNGKVYAQGATGVLECLDGTDGSLIWESNIPDLLGTEMTKKVTLSGLEYEFEDTTKSTLAWGRSGSPLIYQNLVIATGGVKTDGSKVTLIAFDKNTGQEVWRGGSEMISYGSPAIANLLGRDQITVMAESAALGLDPATGNQIWRTEREGNSHMDANTTQITRISDDQVLLSKGYGLGGELVELIEGGENVETKTIWKSPRVLKTKMMSPVIFEDHAYCLSDGFLECCDLGGKDREPRRKWRKRGRFGNGQLLLVGRHLLVHTEYGVLKLVEASPDKYIELAEFDTISGVCWNTICLYKNYVLVRSELEAACIELKMESAPQTPADDEQPVPSNDASLEAETQTSTNE